MIFSVLLGCVRLTLQNINFIVFRKRISIHIYLLNGELMVSVHEIEKLYGELNMFIIDTLYGKTYKNIPVST